MSMKFVVVCPHIANNFELEMIVLMTSLCVQGTVDSSDEDFDDHAVPDIQENQDPNMAGAAPVVEAL